MRVRKKPKPEIVGICFMVLAILVGFLGHPYMSIGFLLGGLIGGVFGIVIEGR